MGAHGGATGALAAPRSRPRPVFPPVPGGGKHSLGTLKDAAHTRAASPVAALDATTLLLRLRPPGSRTLQATYCDRAFDLVPGLDPFFSEGVTTLPGSRFLLFASSGRPWQARRTLQGRPFIPPAVLVRLQVFLWLLIAGIKWLSGNGRYDTSVCVFFKLEANNNLSRRFETLKIDFAPL